MSQFPPPDTPRRRRVDERQIAPLVEAAVYSALWPVAWVSAVLFGLLTVAHTVFLTGWGRPIMAGTAMVSAACALAIGVRWRRQTSDAGAHLGMALLAILPIVNSTLHLALYREAHLTSNVAATVIGLGLVVLHRRWYAALTTTLVGLFVAIAWLGPVPDIGQWGWLLFFCVFLSVMLNQQRSFSVRRMARREIMLSRRIDRLRTLMRAPELIEADVVGMFRLLCAAASEELGVERVGVWLLEEGGTRIRCAAANHIDPDAGLDDVVVEHSLAPRYFEALRSGATITADDAVTDPFTAELAQPYLVPLGIGAMLDVPILVHGEPIGVICHEHRGGRRKWSVDDRAFAASVADVAAGALQGAEWARLERRNQEAERLESIGLLAGGVAHDFNNLLQVVKGNTELLAEHALPAQRPLVEAIAGATTRASELARQMLAYSGRAPLVKQVIDVATVAERLRDRWSRDLLGATELQVTLPEEALPGVEVDATQVRQVLLNLLTNARDAHAARVSVSVGLEHIDGELGHDFVLREGIEPGPYVWIEVADDGAGMEPETIHRMFEPFYSAREGGSGMGLAAVLGILRTHGGTIGVWSTPGEGSRFKLLLPASDLPVEPDVDPPEVTAASAVGLNVWIVDDEPRVRELIRRVLESTGCTVRCFEGRTAVLSAMDPTEIDQLDVAILDLTLGDGDGIDVMHHLRAHRADLPVVIASGYDGADVLPTLAGSSTVAFLHKPFARDELMEALWVARDRAPAAVRPIPAAATH